MVKKLLFTIVIYFVCVGVGFTQFTFREEDEKNEWPVGSVNGQMASGNFYADVRREKDSAGSVVIETIVSNSAVATVRFSDYDFRFLLPESTLLDSGYISEKELGYPPASTLADALERGLQLMVRARQQIAVPVREVQRNGAVGEAVVKEVININKTTVLEEIEWDDSPVALKLLFDIRGTANTVRLIFNVEENGQDAIFVELDSITVNALHQILTIDAGNKFSIMRAMLDQIEGKYQSSDYGA